jgi:hypothetical protein
MMTFLHFEDNESLTERARPNYDNARKHRRVLYTPAANNPHSTLYYNIKNFALDEVIV